MVLYTWQCTRIVAIATVASRVSTRVDDVQSTHCPHKMQILLQCFMSCDCCEPHAKKDYRNVWTLLQSALLMIFAGLWAMCATLSYCAAIRVDVS